MATPINPPARTIAAPTIRYGVRSWEPLAVAVTVFWTADAGDVWHGARLPERRRGGYYPSKTTQDEYAISAG